MKKLLFISSICVFIFCSSCEKENKSDKKEVLCASPWKLSALSVEPSIPLFDSDDQIIGYTSDLFSQLESCDKDDTQQYFKDGSYIYDNKQRCDVSDPQTESGSWFFNENQTSITETDSEGELTTYVILELSDYTFRGQ